MIADISTLATAVTALGVLVSSGTALYSVMKNGRKLAETKDSIEANTGITVATAQSVAAINHAVNGKSPGDQTMVSQIQDLHDDRPDVTSLPSRAEGVGIRQTLETLAMDVKELKQLASDVADIKRQILANGNGGQT